MPLRSPLGLSVWYTWLTYGYTRTLSIAVPHNNTQCVRKKLVKNKTRQKENLKLLFSPSVLCRVLHAAAVVAGPSFPQGVLPTRTLHHLPQDTKKRTRNEALWVQRFAAIPGGGYRLGAPQPE